MGNTSSQPTPATAAKKLDFDEGEAFTSTPRMSRDQAPPRGALHALQEATRKAAKKKSKRLKRDVEAEDEELRRLQLSQMEPEVQADAAMDVDETSEEVVSSTAEALVEASRPVKKEKRKKEKSILREIEELHRMEAEADIAAASMQVATEAAEPVVEKKKKARGKPSGLNLVPARPVVEVGTTARAGVDDVQDEAAPVEVEEHQFADQEDAKMQHRRSVSSGSFRFRRRGERSQDTTVAQTGSVDIDAVIAEAQAEDYGDLDEVHGLPTVSATQDYGDLDAVHGLPSVSATQDLPATGDEDAMLVDRTTEKANSKKKRKRADAEDPLIENPLPTNLDGTNEVADSQPGPSLPQKKRKKRKVAHEVTAVESGADAEEAAEQAVPAQGLTPPESTPNATLVSEAAITDETHAAEAARTPALHAEEPRRKGKLKRKRPSQPLEDIQQGPASPAHSLAMEDTTGRAASKRLLRETAMPGGYKKTTTFTEQLARNTDEGRPAKHNPIKGPFSEAEKVLADEIYHQCLEQSGMEEPQFIAQIQNWKDAGTFKTAVQDALPNRPIVAIRKFCQRRYHGAQAGNWTAEQDEALRQACVSKPGKWTEISGLVGRTAASCKDRWRHQIDVPATHQLGPWSVEEEELLREAIRFATETLQAEKDEPLPTDHIQLSAQLAWQPIADHVATRNAKQCREKWSKLNRKGSRKADRARTKYARCQVGDLYAMFTEIHTAIPDHTYQYEHESVMWARVSMVHPQSCYSSALRRVALEDAKETYKNDIVLGETAASAAKALAEGLEQDWGLAALEEKRAFRVKANGTDENENEKSTQLVANAQHRMEAQQRLAEEKDQKRAEKRSQLAAERNAAKKDAKKATASASKRFKSAAVVVESDEDDEDDEEQAPRRLSRTSGHSSFVAHEDPTAADPIEDSHDDAAAVSANALAATANPPKRKRLPKVNTNRAAAARKQAAAPVPFSVPEQLRTQSFGSVDSLSPTTRLSGAYLDIPLPANYAEKGARKHLARRFDMRKTEVSRPK